LNNIQQKSIFQFKYIYLGYLLSDRSN